MSPTERTPYRLTEPRELVLRAIATAAHTPGLDHPVPRPLPLSASDIGASRAWLHTHGYLADDATPSDKGAQVAVWLSRAGRHDAIVEPWPRLRRTGGHRGTRVRCSCGWGGSRTSEDPATIRTSAVGLHHGGRTWAEVEHRSHLAPPPGPPREADTLARLAALRGDEDPL